MTAIQTAVERGFGVEIDLHLTKDNEVVVIHDANLLRLCGVDANIWDYTLEELSKVKLLTGETIPTFKQVLKLVNNRVPLLVELKVDNDNHKQLTDTAMSLLKDSDLKLIALQSFYPKCIKYAVKNYPQILTGQLSSGLIEGHGKFINMMFYTLRVLMLSHGGFVSFDVKYLPNKYVERYRKRGGKVLCWLVNDEQKLKIAQAYADNIIFENIY